MSAIIKGRFRFELISTIAKYTPFGPVEIDNIFETTKSMDMVFWSIEYALLNAVDLSTARDTLLKPPILPLD